MEVQENNSDEGDVWAQTIFTITPQENGTLREIIEETQISGNPNEKLELEENNIIREHKIESPAKHVIDSDELSREPFAEVECQTYIQDIEKIHIPIEFKDEASQTFYIGTRCRVENVVKEVIAGISKKSLPILKSGEKSQTIVTFDVNYPRDEIIEKLVANQDSKISEIKRISSTEENIFQIHIWHLLNYIIDRVFWNSDPEEPIREYRDVESQTDIICNWKTGKVIFNQETQTQLTCEPKVSNSKLIGDYLETKNFVINFVEDCLSKGVYNRMIIDDIFEEILNNCSREIRFPFLDNGAQTLATYKTVDDDGDEDILKKLRRPLAVDPEESKIVINHLMNDFIEDVFVAIAKEIEVTVKFILCVLIRNSILIAVQLREKRKIKEPKLLDTVFIERKKKLAKRERPKVITVSTQTKLAGVPEVKKIGELLESTKIFCSACATESECCHFCTESRNSDFHFTMKQTEILQTQDILLTYKPCYIENKLRNVKTPRLQVPQLSEKSEKIHKICSPSTNSETSTNSSMTSSEYSNEPLKKICRKSLFFRFSMRLVGF
ncbi:uncharacterized protein LOC122499710 isoform X2 [Leptopilina heterotoma]|uniref:uncharacterized protein LOC122499710 isoform X2 n=1 Tax=Leptopilina heterotoma TaxID=63436 RepID=UPI001CAA3D79|nr:uncharacterized protein LOC122499710 isoform X2 [Leptopilina heterotoma]